MPGLLFLLIGISVLALLAFIPIWSASVLLADPVFAYFLGDAVPGSVIILCLAALMLFVFVVAVLCIQSPKAMKSEQNMLLLTSLFLTLLGAGLLLASWPIRRTGLDFSEEVFRNCESGQTKIALSRTWKQLHALRSSPACAQAASVEACPGFQFSEHTDMLRQMEQRLQCSGWCHGYQDQLPAVTRGGATVVDSADAASFFQRGRAISTRNRSQRREAFPPTLFSLANFQATCDGMAALSIKGSLEDLADELFHQGAALISIFIGMGLLSLLGDTKVPSGQAAKQRSLPSQEGGSVSGATYGAVSTSTAAMDS